ncbi:DNA-binding transcriptional regulator [Ruminococcus sp. XPD3002]|uniref:helix-turn-helix domain-containing protein n=1 Tax=Ruminococcus sp. XPD3002 TaxID=1452269 RepID=UPI00091A397F|nr:putative transcriptional regulator [Ruminococcus flavefaciens]
MKAFDSIMKGLNEAVEYEKGEKTARSERVTIIPPPNVSASEVRELRLRLNMTQSAFAALMGVTNKTVEAWEKGTNTPAGTARRMIGLLEADNSIPEKYNIINY